MDLQHLAAQLRKPQGEGGRQVGEIMNKGNQLVNQWAVEALALQDEDVVLEIGMGNGAFVKDIISAHQRITYCGVDYSPTMVDEAIRINQDIIDLGKASFTTGDAAQLPFESNHFNKIFTVNTIYFWEDAQVQLAEINRVLRPGGTAVFAIRTKSTMDQMPFTEFGFTKYDLQELTDLVAGHFQTMNAFVRKEPPYLFNQQPMILENAFVVCTKKR